MSSASRPITAADLKHLNSPQLAALLRNPLTASKVAVIDVRDSDHVGGHIKGSSWVPTSELDARIPELIRLNQDKDKVVFHCMLSQQRGPSSALKFMRALAQQAQKQAQEQSNTHGGSTGDADVAVAPAVAASQHKLQQRESMTRPQVYILEGGFGMWASRYGDDADLTESFAKDLWE
jgi:rhodanese-related sulfurtransferase